MVPWSLQKPSETSKQNMQNKRKNRACVGSPVESLSEERCSSPTCGLFICIVHKSLKCSASCWRCYIHNRPTTTGDTVATMDYPATIESPNYDYLIVSNYPIVATLSPCHVIHLRDLHPAESRASNLSTLRTRRRRRPNPQRPARFPHKVRQHIGESW